MKRLAIIELDTTDFDTLNQQINDKIWQTAAEIQCALSGGDLLTAKEAVDALNKQIQDKVRETCFIALFQNPVPPACLRKPGGRKALRFVSYQLIWITPPTGTAIWIYSLFFVKAAPWRGRKKRGPQKRGRHLSLSLTGFVDKADPYLAFHAAQSGISAPSFAIASEMLKLEGIFLSPRKIRHLTERLNKNDCCRVERLLEGPDDHPLENRRVLLTVDGGRLRWRKNKKGRAPANLKRRGFHCDWIELKLSTVHVLDKDGKIKKSVAPFVDGVTGKRPAFMKLLTHYLFRSGIDKAREVIAAGDGAQWIWARIPVPNRKIDSLKLIVTEIIDRTHAWQNLFSAFGMLSKKKAEKTDFKNLKALLFQGAVSEIVNTVKSLFKSKTNSNIMKKQKNCFVKNAKRMQYASFQQRHIPIGSGVIESAIRRVVNLRLKAPGSFWKLDFAETMIFLRAWSLYGRWEILRDNRNRQLRLNFKDVVASSTGLWEQINLNYWIAPVQKFYCLCDTDSGSL